MVKPVVVLTSRFLQVWREFGAGQFFPLPPAHLTPYAGINAVPASSFVQVEPGHAVTYDHWQFDPSHRVCYRDDASYEEQFRHLFAEAVRRRLRSDSPVLAELSGGMDSTSIVCMADALGEEGKAETPRLDTISYYDDGEPNWNERPYFSLIEKRRGRHGHHIDVGGTEGALLPPDVNLFLPLPGCDRVLLTQLQEFIHSLQSRQRRLLLSDLRGYDI